MTFSVVRPIRARETARSSRSNRGETRVCQAPDGTGSGAERVGAHRTSMLQDLEAGKPHELAPVIGAVVELAELVEADIPATRAVYAAATLLDQISTARARQPP